MVAPTAVPVLSFGSATGRWVLLSTVLGSALAFVDATVVNIALPAIGADLGGGTAGLTWTVNAYTLTLAALLLLGGSLGDRLGRRRVFVAGVIWFSAASVLCGLAPNVELLVAARAVQGVGGALLVPGSLAILQASFRPDDRSRAIGAWSGLTGVAGAVGPFLGGWLVGVGSWRWVFLVNVPVAVVVLVAVRHVPESSDPTAPRRLDVAGAGLVAGGLGALTWGLTRWADSGLVPVTGLWLLAGVAALGGFVGWEARSDYPMVPLDIFASRLFTATNVVTLVVYAALGGVMLWLVVTLQVVAGFTALAAGLALLPVTMLMLAFSERSGALVQRVGPRVPMTAGPAIAAVGTALLARVDGDATYVADVFGPVVLLGIGLTLTVTPLTATVLAALPDARAGVASGVNNAVARSAQLLAVAGLPLATGLGRDGFSDPEALLPAFEVAMVVCAGLLALGSLLSAAFVRRGRSRRPAEPPEFHCAVCGPPTGYLQQNG